MQELFNVGLIVKPQGIKGELKVNAYTDDIRRFEKLKEVIIDGKPIRVIKGKACGTFAILSIEGVYDRNTAELYRNKEIFVKRSNSEELKKGSYYIADLIGSKLLTEKEEIGTILDVTASNTDYITARLKDGKILRFPFLKDLLIKVDVEKGEMTVKEERLKEVGCYED